MPFPCLEKQLYKVIWLKFNKWQTLSAMYAFIGDPVRKVVVLGFFKEKEPIEHMETCKRFIITIDS